MGSRYERLYESLLPMRRPPAKNNLPQARMTIASTDETSD
jgi:hypothetical protein